MATGCRFPWGKVLERFSYDFDGSTMDVVKFHPWKADGCIVKTGEPDTSRVHYHCEELQSSYGELDALLICWIAKKRLGINQHVLVSGVCRALGVYQLGLPPEVSRAARRRLERSVRP